MLKNPPTNVVDAARRTICVNIGTSMIEKRDVHVDFELVIFWLMQIAKSKKAKKLTHEQVATRICDNMPKNWLKNDPQTGSTTTILINQGAHGVYIIPIVLQLGIDGTLIIRQSQEAPIIKIDQETATRMQDVARASKEKTDFASILALLNETPTGTQTSPSTLQLRVSVGLSQEEIPLRVHKKPEAGFLKIGLA